MTQAADHERFVAALARHEPELRAFLRSLLPTWEGVDEVMQNVALAAWRKFGDFEAGTDFIRWACVIARFEALQYRRTKARDRLVFSLELIELMANEGLEELDRRERERQALEACIRKLPTEKRELLLKVYTPGIKVKDLAERAGQTAGSVYTLLNRLRATLLECIHRQLASDGAAS